MPTPVPRALISRNPLEWLRVFGPGAIIASLTIGTGELIFSTRGGAIFGYPVLFLFALICLLKWTLAYSAARHMVITGMHPFQSWMDFPLGPRGWLPLLFFLLAAVTIPVWVGFHSSVLGDLLAGLTDTKKYLSGATVYLWGIGLLIGVFALAVAGGYSALEKIQLVIVTGMLIAVIVTLIMLGPNWIDLLRGFVVPQRLEFPDWLLRETRPAAAENRQSSRLGRALAVCRRDCRCWLRLPRIHLLFARQAMGKCLRDPRMAIQMPFRMTRLCASGSAHR